MSTNLYEPLVVVSRAITEADTGATVQAIDVPAKTLVVKVALVITEAFAGGAPALKVGDGDNDDGWVHSDDITEGTIGAYVGDETTTAAYCLGKYYAAADTIDVIESGGACTNGTAYVVAQMIRLDEVV